MNSPILSIIIPVYNNQQTIKDLYHQIMAEMNSAHLSFEVVFVNDNSSDSSKNEIIFLQKEFDNVILVNNPKNIGQQKSILKGLQNAKGQFCVVMDADLQDSPKHIISLYESLKPPFEAIFVKRVGDYQSRQRMLSSHIFKSISSLLSGLSKKAGTFFIIRSNLIERLVKFNCKFIYITYMVACLTSNKIGYLSVTREKNLYTSQYTSTKRLKAAINGLMCIFECKLKRLLLRIR